MPWWLFQGGGGAQGDAGIPGEDGEKVFNYHVFSRPDMNLDNRYWFKKQMV